MVDNELNSKEAYKVYVRDSEGRALEDLVQHGTTVKFRTQAEVVEYVPINSTQIDNSAVKSIEFDEDDEQDSRFRPKRTKQHNCSKLVDQSIRSSTHSSLSNRKTVYLDTSTDFPEIIYMFFAVVTVVLASLYFLYNK